MGRLTSRTWRGSCSPVAQPDSQVKHRNASGFEALSNFAQAGIGCAKKRLLTECSFAGFLLMLIVAATAEFRPPLSAAALNSGLAPEAPQLDFRCNGATSRYFIVRRSSKGIDLGSGTIVDAGWATCAQEIQNWN